MPSTQQSGTVNFLIESMPTNLDPRIGIDAQSEYLDGLIFDGLVQRDAQMNVVPDLAQTWEMPNPLTYVFHLRHEVRFHDGRPFTSADVKFTIDSILTGAVPTPKRGAFKRIASIDAPDEATVVVHLSEPYSSFLLNLSRLAIGIVPRESPEPPARHPVGTGPFRFVSMMPDEEILLERNANYFGRVPKVDRVHFRIVPEAIVRALELRKGTADIGGVNSLTPDMVMALEKQRDIAVEQEPGTELAYVAFNFDDPILAKRDVRQALAYATDRGSVIRYLLRGKARPANSLLPPNHWAYEADVKQYPYDPQQAEQLLDRAGFSRNPRGVRFHLTLKTSTEESTRLLGETLAEQWKRVGVDLALRPLESATFFSDIGRGSFQLYTLRWTGLTNDDPDIFDYVFNSQRMPPDGANRGHYHNPELDSLLHQQGLEMDQTRRKAILSEIQKIIAEDEPYIDLWYYDNVCVHRDRVTGIMIPPGGDYDFLDRIEVGITPTPSAAYAPNAR
ncbi:MAG TPA: ABC transporter substrate-binding protein [Candidatus Acidoferrum sp.]|nr:ABC transporter substrate-binding protein [Candidatus Acidoferrum sp.]